MVTQEVWALLLTHYRIRQLMCQAADEADADPDRLSFIRSLGVIRRQVANQADFPPDQFHKALAETIDEILERPTTTRHRTNPRAVKRRRHNNHPVRKTNTAASPTPAHPPSNSDP
jgi:hypothetical protein